jgi:hypothetical protein
MHDTDLTAAMGAHGYEAADGKRSKARKAIEPIEENVILVALRSPLDMALEHSMSRLSLSLPRLR